jgi:hypothetical protein
MNETSQGKSVVVIAACWNLTKQNVPLQQNGEDAKKQALPHA